MKKTIKVSLSFGTLPDGAFGDFGNTILANLYSHSEFSAPPVSVADLGAGVTAFKTAKVAQATGGKEATAAKNQRREELLAMLKDLAYYVQVACGNDLEVLLSSGFQATKQNRVPTAMPTPMVERITNGLTGEALVTAKAERFAKTYEAQAAELDENGTPGPYGPSVLQTSSRRIPLPGLTPGKIHIFRVRLVGSKGAVSNWSDPVAQRVM